MRERAVLSVVICFTCLVVSMATIDDAQAASSFSYEITEEDQKEIERDESIILADVNVALEAMELPQISQIDLSDCMKIYIDTDIFQSADGRKETIMEMVERGDCVYDCYTQIEGHTVRYTIAKGDEADPHIKLSEDEQAHMQRQAGHWCMSATGIVEQSNYSELLQKMDLSRYEDVIIAGSLPGFRQPVAIGFQGGYATAVIPFRGANQYEILEQMKGEPVGKGLYAYDYNEVAKLAEREASAKNPDEAGGEGVASDQNNSILQWNKIFCIVGAVALAGLVLTIVISRIKKPY